LASLGLTRWKDAKPDDIKSIWKCCDAYFQRNPYDRWFNPLNMILSQVGVSYYDEFQPACHLDLVPYATTQKWSALTKVQQQQLGMIGAASLLQLLRASKIKILVLNGKSVVREFSRLLAVSLIPQEVPAWALPNSRGGVRGYAYELSLTEILGKALGRRILVLGYNHNIQSSFGVTHEVIAEISGWISQRAHGVTL